MKKTLLIGEHASRKEKLIPLLLDKEIKISRAMAIKHYDFIVHSPSEFLEKRYLINSLITTSFNCDCILLVMGDLQKSTRFPPAFASLFTKPVIGIITTQDVENWQESENKKRAEKFLQRTKVKTIISIDLKTGEGLGELKKILKKDSISK